MAETGAFLEWADVFGRHYGTARAAVEESLIQGRDLLLDIDVQGARQVRASSLDSVSIFVLPPDFPTLESRLRDRRSDDDAQVRRRLALARGETEDFAAYDYLVVNDELERAVSDLVSIVTAERLRTARSARQARRILETFPAPHAGA